jgi:hypothetical protein
VHPGTQPRLPGTAPTAPAPPKPPRGSYYKYRLSVFCPWTREIETVEATDPYSRCTAANGERTLILDLDDPQLAPPGTLILQEATHARRTCWHAGHAGTLDLQLFI